MKRHFAIRFSLFAILSASFAVSALAQSGGGFDLTWSTIDSGGAMNSTGGPFALSGSIGQPDAQLAPVMSGGAFQLTGGSWPVTLVCYCPADMNGDTRKDARDIQRFVECVVAGGACSCADVDAVNGVNLADVGVFVADLISGAACP